MANCKNEAVSEEFADFIVEKNAPFDSPFFNIKDFSGKTRIEAIWDQTINDGLAPDGFFYGTEYDKDRINEGKLKKCTHKEKIFII
jgi:hypothetical protein